MKDNIKIVEEMIYLFGEEAFYCISMYGYEVAFQGKFNQKIVIQCQKDGYNIEVDTNGHLCFKKDLIRITLTQ